MSELKLKWEFVLTLSDINQYLSYSEILVCSQLSNFTRLKLRHKIFQSVNINELVDYLTKDTTINNDKLDLSIEILNSKYSSIKQLVKSIEFNMLTNPFITPLLTSYFNFLTKLTISEFIIPHYLLTYIFEELKLLQCIKLNYCLALYPPGSKASEVIDLPPNLTSLELTYNAALITPEYDNVEKFTQLQLLGESETTPVNLTFSKNFKKLSKLRYIKVNDTDHNSLKNYILNCTVLEEIDIYLDQLTPEIFDSLSHCKSLKSVIIRPISGSYQLLEYEQYPAIPQVTKLSLGQLQIWENQTIVNYMILPFANLQHLTIPIVKGWQSTNFPSLISGLKKLKKLTINWTRSSNALEQFCLHSNSLAVLEFMGFDTGFGFEFGMLQGCPLVSRVYIDTSKFSIISGNLYAEELESYGGWYVLKYGSSLNCIKYK